MCEPKINISSNEQKQLELMIDHTIMELDIAQSVALNETKHLDQIQREIIENDYNVAKKLFNELKAEIVEATEQSSLNSDFVSEALGNFIEEHTECKAELTRATQKVKETKESLNALKVELSDELVKNYQETQALNEELGLLKDKYQDNLWEQEVKLRYSSDWLQSQSKQHELRLKNKENELLQQVADLQSSMEKEHRVHDEMEDFYSMKLGEYIQQLVYWVDKYEHDKQYYDEKITKLKSDHDNLLEKIESAKNLYTSRQAEITAYEEIKEQRRLHELHLQHLNKNATKIQAWWKGMMVRCKLGPYKVKKSKGKGKSKKKKIVPTCTL